MEPDNPGNPVDPGDIQDLAGNTPPGDLSMTILRELFGPVMDNVLMTGGLGDAGLLEPVQGFSGILGAMFAVVNAFAIIATALVLLYLYAVAVMQTAHDGEPLGKRFSTLWTPLRTVISVVFCAPFPGGGGYSVLQVLILSLVVLSIHGANLLWNTALDQYERFGSMIPSSAIGQSVSSSVPVAIMSSMVCMEAVNDKTERLRGRNEVVQTITLPPPPPDAGGGNWGINPGEPGPGRGLLTVQWGTIGRSRVMQRPFNRAECGGISVDCSGTARDSSEFAACIAVQNSVLAMINSLAESNVATQLLNEELPEGNPIANALIAYQGTFNQALPVIQALIDRDFQNLNRDFLADAKATGWLSAGAWYWTISSASLQMLNALSHEPVLTPIALEGEGLPQRIIAEDVIPVLDRVQVLMARIPDAIIVPDIGDLEPVGGALGDGFVGDSPPRRRVNAMRIVEREISASDHRRSEHIIESTFQNELSGLRSAFVNFVFDRRAGDPIRSMSELGHYMINTSAVLFINYARISAATSAIDAVAESAANQPAVGLGPAAFRAVTNLAASFVSALSAAMVALIGVMVISGIMLAYYLPMIPAIFWLFGVLGWLIMIIESMIAAPLWAVSHAVPEGDGFAGRYALLGYQMMVNVVFRPVLLLLGLLMAMMIMHAIAQFAMWVLAIAMESIVSIASGGIRGILIWLTSAVALVFIMGAVMIQLTHKVHEIIFVTADNVMRWIGFGVTPLGSISSGEASVMGTVKGGLGSAGPLLGTGLAMQNAGRQRAMAPTQKKDGGGGEPSNAATKQTQADAPSKDK